MREGSLEAPTRHPIDWHNPDFWDEAKLEAELRRVAPDDLTPREALEALYRLRALLPPP